MAIVNHIRRAALDAAVACAATVGMAAVIDKPSPEIARIARAPAVRENLVAPAAEPVGCTPKQFAAMMGSELKKWSAVIRQTAIGAD